MKRKGTKRKATKSKGMRPLAKVKRPQSFPIETVDGSPSVPSGGFQVHKGGLAFWLPRGAAVTVEPIGWIIGDISFAILNRLFPELARMFHSTEAQEIEPEILAAHLRKVIPKLKRAKKLRAQKH